MSWGRFGCGAVSGNKCNATWGAAAAAVVFQGTLSVGVSVNAGPPRPTRGKTLLHPSVARLEQQLAAAAAVMTPPAAVPPLELPPVPSFRKK